MKSDMSAVENDAAVVRAMIDGENRLVNDRVTWLLTSQGFLAAAIAFAWDKPTGPELIRVFCVLGVFLAVVSLMALVGATMAQHRMLAWWDAHRPLDYDGPDVIGLRPVHGRFLKHLAPWNALALAFVVAWMFIWLKALP